MGPQLRKHSLLHRNALGSSDSNMHAYGHPDSDSDNHHDEHPNRLKHTFSYPDKGHLSDYAGSRVC